jgi:hypothetical protein
MFAQISATTTAATSTPALPDSVRRNVRSGAERSRDQSVFPRHNAAAADSRSFPESVIACHD